MSTFINHVDLVTTDIHSLRRWVHANSTERLAESVAASDIGKLSHQTDDDSLHVLVSTTPSVWKDITAEAAAASDAEDLIITATKGSVGTIAIGEAVYITGYNLGLSAISVEPANAGSASTMPAIGIARTSFTNANTGVLVASGELTGQDTTGNGEAWAVGEALYVSTTDGVLTDVRPDGTALVQKVATVNRVNASTGVIQVVGAGRSNDVPNIPEDQLWLGNASGVATPTARAGIDTDSATHIGTTTGNPHDVEGIELLDGTSASTKVLQTDGTGGFALIDTPTGAAWLEEAITPTLGQITFILSQAPTEPASLSLHANGIEAKETDDYTLSGTTLTWLNSEFSFETNDDIVIKYK